MPLFWILVTGMMLLALAFVLPPLFRKTPRSSVDRDQLNIEVIRQQLAELDTDLNNGKLDQSAYAAARNDLEKELLYDLSDNDKTSVQKPGKGGRWASVLLVVSIPVVTLLVYQQIGASKLIPLLQAENTNQNPSANTGAPRHASLPELVAKLLAKLEAEPNNPEGWLLLARSYMAMGRYADAAKTYEQLRQLAGDHPKILVSYADALAMVHNGQLAGKPIELINKALAIEPNEPQGLWLAGMAAEQQGEYDTALNYWRRLEPMLKGDPTSQQEIAQLIAQAERKAGHIPAKTETVEKPTEAASRAVTTAGSAKIPGMAAKALKVHVSLEPDLSAQASPDDTLFVFARALQGPPMPLAIVRKQVKDLPLVVTLDDSMAMSPGLKLSNFAQIRVSARISKSGNALPQSGDLYGEVAPVTLDENTPVEITIAKVRP
jgi:cytochrome c-type biogenesis protein CcmH